MESLCTDKAGLQLCEYLRNVRSSGVWRQRCSRNLAYVEIIGRCLAWRCSTCVVAWAERWVRGATTGTCLLACFRTVSN
jgi:hypothetical protein